MADNLDVTPGTGATVAADLISGALHQRVKLSVGADGEAADLDSGQATMANSLPVAIASDQSAIKTSDNGPAWTSVWGVTGAAVVSADMTSAAAVTDAPTGGQKIVVDDIIVSTDTAMSVLFEEQTSGTDVLKIFLPANGTAQITPRGKLKLATADKYLTAKASAAGNIAITVTYHSEA